jgi:catechol 2,3-dioxygenase-like lactoylglutathione lyase family enzyme
LSSCPQIGLLAAEAVAAVVTRPTVRVWSIAGCRALPAGPRQSYPSFMLTDGFNHVAVLTSDTDRLHTFYTEVFDAVVGYDDKQPDLRLSFVHIGPHTEFNVFELYGDHPAPAQVPMFGRGRLDHIGLQAASLEAFEEIRRRLLARGACDEFVTDFGPVLSLFFHDPDGLEAEVCVENPDAVPGTFNPPGTPAHRYVT